MPLKEYVARNRQHFDEGGEAEAVVETQASAPTPEPNVSRETSQKKHAASPLTAFAGDPKTAAERDARMREFYNKQLADAKAQEGSFGELTGIDAVLRKYGSLSPEGHHVEEKGLQDAYAAREKSKAAATAGLADLDTQQASLNTRKAVVDAIKAGDLNLAATIDPTLTKDIVGSKYSEQKVKADIAKTESETAKNQATATGSAGGAFDKNGNYKTPSGTLIPKSEVSKDRTERAGYDLLKKRLAAITTEKINAAEGINWTSAGEASKWLGNQISPKTVDAQSEINAILLQSVMGNLPPGPASDKDIAQARSDFPGFGDKVALNNWITRVRDILDTKMAQQDGKYGAENWYGESGTPKEGNKTPSTPGKSATPSKPASQKIEYTVGMIRNGYRYKGGDPTAEANWEPVNA